MARVVTCYRLAQCVVRVLAHVGAGVRAGAGRAGAPSLPVRPAAAARVAGEHGGA